MYMFSHFGRTMHAIPLWLMLGSVPMMTFGEQPLPTSAPVPIAALRTAQQQSPMPVTVQGVITRTGDRMYVQDKTAGLQVTAAEPRADLRIGDEVRVTGIPIKQRYSSVLQADIVQLIRARLPDPPLAITPGMAASGAYADLLIDTDGIFLRSVDMHGVPALLLHENHQFFLALLPQPVEGRLRNLKAGSKVRVRGVCAMSDEASYYPAAFHIWLRSAQDVSIVSGPPFWNRSHFLLLVAFLLVLVYAALLLIRRFERWRFQLILEERVRLAHDLHDTLAQSFAGIAFQLKAIRSAIRNQKDVDEIQQHVDLAVGMVSHSHEDARRSIAMLKPAPALEDDFMQQLCEQARLLTRGGEIQVIATEAQHVAELEPTVRNALLRIGHEAITNTVRHASASTISIDLRVAPTYFVLTITDDGRGFAGSSHQRGFGLSGMQARAASCGGSVDVASSPGSGCTVRAVLPLRPPRRYLGRWVRSFLNRKG